MSVPRTAVHGGSTATDAIRYQREAGSSDEPARGVCQAKKERRANATPKAVTEWPCTGQQQRRGGRAEARLGSGNSQRSLRLFGAADLPGGASLLVPCLGLGLPLGLGGDDAPIILAPLALLLDLACLCPTIVSATHTAALDPPNPPSLPPSPSSPPLDLHTHPSFPLSPSTPLETTKMTTDLPPEVHFPLEKQMLPVPGSKQPGFSSIYRSAALPEWSSNCTVYETLLRAKEENLNEDVAGWRPWNPVTRDFEKHFEWYSHAEVEEERTAIGSGIGELARQGRLGQGVAPSDFTVGIWTLNRPEFMVIDYANIAYSRRTVSLYETYDAASAQYIIDHAETRILFTTPNHVGVVLAAAQAGKLPLLKAIVMLDAFRPSKQSVKAAIVDPQRDALAKEWAKTCGIEILTWFEVLDLGRAHLAAHIPPSLDTIHSFCYTSGTTGNPKAAIITAGMGGYVTTAMAFHKRSAHTLISYLPTAHIYARLCELVAVRTGGRVGYFCGDTTRLLEDMAILRPHMFPSVPRVLNRIAALVQAQAAAPGIKGALLRRALAAKIANHDRDGTLTHPVYDRLIFSKVQALLGGRVEYIVSGSAPIRGDVLKLLRVVLACDVREGYGQTENYGFCTIMSPNDISLGSVGAIYPGMELKLRDVTDMGYTSEDQPFARGELLVRSQCTFPGYYKDEAKTRETLTDDGFLRTGDIVAIDALNRVKIVDRVKSLLKLSQGEYVAIDNLSEFYGQNPLAAQLLVHGDSFRDYLIGISVPEPTTFAPMASKVLGRNISAEDTAALQEACADEKVVAAYLEQYTSIARKNNLKGYEYIKGLYLTMDAFSVENGLLTPTFKVKRHEAVKQFADQIEQVYARGPINVSSGRAKL